MGGVGSGRTTRLLDEEIALIHTMYAEGKSLRTIGKQVACSHELVRNILQAGGVEIRSRGVQAKDNQP